MVTSEPAPVIERPVPAIGIFLLGSVPEDKIISNVSAVSPALREAACKR